MPAGDRVTGPAQILRQILFHLGGGLIRHRVQVLMPGNFSEETQPGVGRLELHGRGRNRRLPGFGLRTPPTDAW